MTFPSLPLQLCEQLPSLAECRAFVQRSLSCLSPAHRRLQSPELYQVVGGPAGGLAWPVCPLPPPQLLIGSLLSSLQVALSEKLQALVDSLSAGGSP